VSGDPVAVSLVWLLTRTTVFSSTEALQGVEPAAVAPVLPPPAVVAVPVEEAPALVVPVIDLDITPEPGVGVLPAAQSGIA
jgi:hypothetical protein